MCRKVYHLLSYNIFYNLNEKDISQNYLGKACLQCKRHRFNPWVRKSPWRRKWQPTLVLLPGKSHGRRSLVGFMGSQRVGHDWATSLSLSPSLGFLPGEFHGRGACQATVHGIAKSQKQLSDLTTTINNNHQQHPIIL